MQPNPNWPSNLFEVAFVPLSGGRKFALVDLDDLQRLSAFSWQCNGRYASRIDPSTKKNYQMHREVISARSGLIVDHANGLRLDNRKCNLRECTAQENAWNQRRRASQSGAVGVQRLGNSRFRMTVSHRGQVLYGFFPTAESAAEFRDELIKLLRGEFAVLRMDSIDEPIGGRSHVA